MDRERLNPPFLNIFRMSVILVSLTALLSVACSAPEKRNFERIRAGIPLAPTAEPELEKDYNGNRYFVSGNISFPFYGRRSHMAIQSAISGHVGVFWVVFSRDEDVLDLAVQSPDPAATPRGLDPVQIHPGANEIFVELDLADRETLRVRSRSGSDFTASTPIVYPILSPENRQCIFLISADTLGSRHLPLYGYDKISTPNMQSLAEDGVIFRNAYANSSWTVASHMSLFTSRFEHRHRVKVAKSFVEEDSQFTPQKRYIFPLPDSIPFLVENLSRRLITISVNGGANVSGRFGFFRGFDFYLSRGSDLRDPNAAQKMFERVGRSLLKYRFPHAFFFLHTYHVHMPYNPDEVFLGRVAQDPVLKAFDFDQDLGGMRKIFRTFPEETVRNVTALYDAEILGFDHYLGEFIAFLKKNGLYDGSLIILLSDHGEEFMEHGSWAHATDLYNEQIGVPLIIKFPAQEFRGEEIDANVSLVDVMPTILDYLSIECPGELDGRSLMGRIKRREKAERTVVASLFRSKPFSYLPGKLALIQGDFKLIFNEPHEERTSQYFIPDPPFVGTVEAYLLREDPWEKNDLIQGGTGPAQLRPLIQDILKLADEMKENTIDLSGAETRSMPQELIDQLKALGYIK